MKENIKITLSKGFEDPLIITCPICGFTFRSFDPKTRNKKLLCPMCNYSFLTYSKFKFSKFYLTDKNI